MASKYSVLIVDDESGIRQSLSSVLRDEGYTAEAVATGEEAVKVLAQRRFDLVMLDIWLPGMDGLATLEKIQSRANPPAVIMISGHGTIETAVRATRLGAFDFIEKPLSIDKTLLTLQHAFEQFDLSAENRQLQEQIYGRRCILGESVP
ncbi:MAG: response regulator, partial [Terriglobia bacterium]